jgi:crotonobetainyl-CoA:carnitine CoA-transferase CaiB-like acyl-CoA transferase
MEGSGSHQGILQGVRVVELASWTYVPSAGAALSDWGADVIKVEGVTSGDPGRALVVGPFTREAARPDADFILEMGNRGKRSIAIDVKSETGRDLFGRLLASADVFLTNWLPGALERARLTVEDIRSFNPKIIIARGTGLGVRGPDRDRGGFDAATYLARGGVAYTLTPFGTETPAVQGPGFGDLQGGRRWPAACAPRFTTGRRPVSRPSSIPRCWPRRCGRLHRRFVQPISSISTAFRAHHPGWP